MKIIRVILIALLFPIAAQATTGAQLREDCASFDEKTKSANLSTNTMRGSECLGYIYGVLDLPKIYVVQGADYCAPDGTTRGVALQRGAGLH
jgi:hypothetical protein